MEPTFSLVYTSVRPERIRPVVKDWFEKSKFKDLEVILTVDANDSRSQQVAKALADCGEFSNFTWYVQANEPFDCVKGWNLAAEKSTGKVIVQLTDDFVAPALWDEKLLSIDCGRWIDREQVVHVNDGYVQTLCTLAILTRKRYDRFGYLFYPGYESLFCLPPEVPVWMADLSFKPIGLLQPGDEIIGSVRRYGKLGSGKQKRNFLEVVEVMSTLRRRAETVRVTLESGRVLRCTEDHLWGYYGDGRLAYAPKRKQKNGPILLENGFLYGRPILGRKLVRVLDPVDDYASNGQKEFQELGWLGGMMDGEGHFPVITQSSTHNPDVCAEIERILNKFGFSFTSSYDKKYSEITGKKHHQRVFTLTGGKNGYMRFISTVPFIRKQMAAKQLLRSRFGLPDKIVAVESDGFGEVVCLKTTSGNFIADGYLSHNCDTEFTEVAYRDGVVIEAMHLLFEHMHPDCGKRAKDAVDAVHASQDRWQRGEMLFNYRKFHGFPIDEGPKASAETTQTSEPEMKFAAYLQATRDDFCLFEVCERLKEEGVNDFYFSVPDEYWSGRLTPPEEMRQVKEVADRLIQEFKVRAKVMIHRVKTYRFPGDSRLAVETRVRNDALTSIRKDGFKHILIVDGDELWKRGTLELIRHCIKEYRPSAISSGMVPVVGLPGYPVERASDVAVVYIAENTPFRECRTPVGEQYRLSMPQVIHFTGTRRSMEEIILKHRQSGHYDDPDYDFETWIKEVLPNIKPGFQHTWSETNRGIHMYKKYQIWEGIREWWPAEIQEIPKSLWPYLAING